MRKVKYYILITEIRLPEWMLAFIASVFSVIRHPIERSRSSPCGILKWQTIVVSTIFAQDAVLDNTRLRCHYILRYIAAAKFTSANSH